MRTICKQYKNNIRYAVSGTYWVGVGWGLDGCREAGMLIEVWKKRGRIFLSGFNLFCIFAFSGLPSGIDEVTVY